MVLHKAVLLEEVVNLLNLAPGKVIIDATVGGGGHAEEIIPRISPNGMLIGIDRDSESLKIAQERLLLLKGNFRLVNRDFRDIRKIVEDLGIGKVDGILFDLGVSSIQLEAKERGFSIKNNGPLDMRMDRNQGISAKDIVNTNSEAELSHLIKVFGEERFHRRIARAIVDARKKRKMIETTTELADIVRRNIPYKNRRWHIHPATRTFQAFRISVNQELTALEKGIRQIPYILKKGGRLCVISFHSLEDRIVKNVLREFKDKGYFRILTKKPLKATQGEIFKNPRARSARLRSAERIL